MIRLRKRYFVVLLLVGLLVVGAISPRARPASTPGTVATYRSDVARYHRYLARRRLEGLGPLTKPARRG